MNVGKSSDSSECVASYSWIRKKTCLLQFNRNLKGFILNKTRLSFKSSEKKTKKIPYSVENREI